MVAQLGFEQSLEDCRNLSRLGVVPIVAERQRQIIATPLDPVMDGRGLVRCDFTLLVTGKCRLDVLAIIPRPYELGVLCLEETGAFRCRSELQIHFAQPLERGLALSGSSAAPSNGSVNCSDTCANPLIRLDVNTARRVGIGIEFAISAGDFDSAIPRFESWRPSQSSVVADPGPRGPLTNRTSRTAMTRNWWGGVACGRQMEPRPQPASQAARSRYPSLRSIS